MSTGTWTQIFATGAPGSPEPRFGHSMDFDGKRALLFGGHPDMLGLTNDLWAFDPQTSAWTNLIPNGDPGSPPGRRYHASVWTGSRLLVFGGEPPAQWGATNDLWSWNPTTNAWTQLIADGDPASPPARIAATMVWDGTRVILFGGQALGSVSDLWWYDPASNKWTQKIADRDPSAPTPRYFHRMVWAGGHAILFGGAGVQPFNDLWWYDSSANTWTQKIAQGAAGSPWGGGQACALAWTGTEAILVSAPQSFSTTPGSETWSYDPTQNLWTQKHAATDPGVPPWRAYGPMIWDGSACRLFGGYVWQGGLRFGDLWQYQP